MFASSVSSNASAIVSQRRSAGEFSGRASSGVAVDSACRMSAYSCAGSPFVSNDGHDDDADDLPIRAASMPYDWDNLTLDRYLEALSAWTDGMDGYRRNRGEPMPEQPSWILIAQHAPRRLLRRVKVRPAPPRS